MPPNPLATRQLSCHIQPGRPHPVTEDRRCTDVRLRGGPDCRFSWAIDQRAAQVGIVRRSVHAPPPIWMPYRPRLSAGVNATVRPSLGVLKNSAANDRHQTADAGCLPGQTHNHKPPQEARRAAARDRRFPLSVRRPHPTTKRSAGPSLLPPSISRLIVQSAV